MKKIYLLFAAVAAFAFTSCYGLGPEEPNVNDIRVDQSHFEIPNSGGTFNVLVTSEYYWQSSTSDSWITIHENAGSDYESTLYFTVAPNYSATERLGQIVIFSDMYNLSTEINICQSGGATKVDFVFDAANYSEVQGVLTPYGDYYEVGAANFYLELAGVASSEDGMPVSAFMMSIDYSLPANVTDGCGVLKPDTLNPETEDYTYAANTYVPGFVREGWAMGSAIMIIDYATEEMTNYLFKSGDITISAKEGVYSIKGFVTCEDGKVVKLNFEGPITVDDGSGNGGIAPAKKGLQLK